MILPEEIQDRLNVCLERTIACEQAQKGTLQFYDPAKSLLTIVAQKGFEQDFLEHFKEGRPFDSSASGRALGIGAPVIIGDINIDIGFLPHRTVALQAGCRSIKSVPVFSRERDPLGVVATHCPQPRWNWNIISSDLMEDLRYALSLIRAVSPA